MNVNVLILEFVVCRWRFRLFKMKNFFDFREFTFSFDVSHNAFLKASNYFDYNMHLFIFFYMIFSKRRLTDCMIYNSLMNILQRQIIAFITRMTIILKCSHIVKYWTDLSMISATIAFNNITSTFIRSMKLMFVKMNLNHHLDNTSCSSHQKEK